MEFVGQIKLFSILAHEDRCKTKKRLCKLARPIRSLGNGKGKGYESRNQIQMSFTNKGFDTFQRA